MPISARRVAALSTAIGLPVLAVLVALAVLSSPGPPRLDRQDPVRIAVADRGRDGLSDTQTESGQGTEARQPSATEEPAEETPLLGPDFRADPPPAPPNPPAQVTRPQQQQRPAAPRPAPPASDDDDDDDDGDEVCVRTVRRKIGAERIETARGMGYRLRSV